MNLSIFVKRYFLISLFAAIGLVLIANLIEWERVIRFDSSIITFITEFHSELMTKVMIAITTFGNTESVVIISLLALFLLYRLGNNKLEMAIVFLVVGASGAVNYLIKNLVQRIRPDQNPLIIEHGFSFPSGHSMSAFALYGVLAFMVWLKVENKWLRAALISACAGLVLLIGTSRIYLGVHYPSDVIGGFLGGASLIGLAVWFYQQKRTEA
ncbi:phosphatase PAP2 family protein [Tumebacillus lipolyticus]|uniref:Phosphatase PAP2 family protein n=1 Tax=Tumebacillus lipolyticus TaxID=1280370 RepID=A0ABW5A252_9BACL